MLKLTLTLAALAASTWTFAFTEVAAAKPSCGAEDSPSWVWSRCGDGRRGVVTMWGTPKVVDCRHLRDLIRQGDLEPATPWLRGDYSCGRRHAR
jgi:hypothetical protein